MKKLITIIIVIGLVIAGYFFFERDSGEEVSGKPIRIGAILPLTGELSFLGMQMQRGMELAVDDYPNSGIEISYEDDQTFNNRASLDALNKLIVQDVDVVLNSVVNSIKALSATLNREKVPAIVFWDNNKEIIEQGNYVFGMGFSTELAGEDMAEFAYDELDVRSVSVISALDEWSQIISNAFIQKFEKLGGTVDIHERVPVDYQDFRTNILKVKQAKSNALYFPLFPDAINSLVKKTDELSYEGYLLSGDGFIDSNIETLGKLSEGVYHTQVWTDDSNFLNKYKEKYGEDTNPVNLAFVAMGYDAVKVVVDVTREMRERNIPINRQTIRDNLIGFDVSGITGQATFSSDRTATKREMLLVVENGNLELVK